MPTKNSNTTSKRTTTAKKSNVSSKASNIEAIVEDMNISESVPESVSENVDISTNNTINENNSTNLNNSVTEAVSPVSKAEEAVFSTSITETVTPNIITPNVNTQIPDLNALMGMLTSMQSQMNQLQEELKAKNANLNIQRYSGPQDSQEAMTYTQPATTVTTNPVVSTDSTNTYTANAYVSQAMSPNQAYNQYTGAIYAEEGEVTSKTDRLLEYLTSKKSDREVEIIHNRELIGGLTTHIELTGLTIDFRRLGEARILSWQQFEECVSKYRKWFEKEIILLGADYRELGEVYSVPCQKRTNGKMLTRNDLAIMGDMNVHQLEDFYMSLTPEDQHFVCSYWLGKSYEKAPKFYDRYKIEALNRLSNGVFDNVLKLMNGDYLVTGGNLNTPTNAQQNNVINPNEVIPGSQRPGVINLVN